jgi:hypothetical protein
VQGANGTLSKLHWKVLPAMLAVNVNVAVVLLVAVPGFDVIVVFGAVRSIVHVNNPGLVSMLPAGSMARTRNVWPPAANAL